MSADIQAKYNALLLKFVGDRTIPVDPETEMDIHKDIAQYMHEKNKRIQAQAKDSYDAIVASIGEPTKAALSHMLAPVVEYCADNPPGFRSAESMQENNECCWKQVAPSSDALQALVAESQRLGLYDMVPAPKVGMDVSHTSDESIMIVTSRIPL